MTETLDLLPKVCKKWLPKDSKTTSTKIDKNQFLNMLKPNIDSAMTTKQLAQALICTGSMDGLLFATSDTWAWSLEDKTNESITPTSKPNQNLKNRFILHTIIFNMCRSYTFKHRYCGHLTQPEYRYCPDRFTTCQRVYTNSQEARTRFCEACYLHRPGLALASKRVLKPPLGYKGNDMDPAPLNFAIRGDI
jgi:hypothetical protein